MQARGRFSGDPFYARAAATEPRNRSGVAVRAVTSEPDRKARWRFSSGRPWRLCLSCKRGAAFAPRLIFALRRAHLRPALPFAGGFDSNFAQPFRRSRGRDKRMTRPSRLQVPGNFSSKLACHRVANEKIAKSLIANRGSDRRPPALRPGDGDVSDLVRAVDLDFARCRGKRPVLCGICCELVQY